MLALFNKFFVSHHSKKTTTTKTAICEHLIVNTVSIIKNKHESILKHSIKTKPVVNEEHHQVINNANA